MSKIISVSTMSEVRDNVKLSDNFKKNCEVELSLNYEELGPEVELPLNEQFQRLNLLLLGIASILLVNITAVLVVFSVKFTEDESIFLKERFYLQENVEGKSSTKTKYR